MGARPMLVLALSAMIYATAFVVVPDATRILEAVPRTTSIAAEARGWSWPWQVRRNHKLLHRVKVRREKATSPLSPSSGSPSASGPTRTAGPPVLGPVDCGEVVDSVRVLNKSQLAQTLARMTLKQRNFTARCLKLQEEQP